MKKRKLKILKKWKGAQAAILTNQTGYGWRGDYHFRSLREFFSIKRVFIPEHGLFAELQDQVSGKELQYKAEGVEFWNLYGDTEDSLVPPAEKILDLEVVVVDIRDVGARYYTFLTTAYYILKLAKELNDKGKKIPTFIVFDSPNPIGRKVEGSPLLSPFESFVGVSGVVHRHGLTPGELLSYYNRKKGLDLQLYVIREGIFHPDSYNDFNWIPPSPNIPSLSTCYVYPGQCLLEGTNLSEGRGTTRPFEIFGAPFLDEENDFLKKEMEAWSAGSFVLRPLRFKPTFHKYKDQICRGYQIHLLKPDKFHSLFFTLHLLRMIKILYPKHIHFPEGVYEFRSDRPAIELLAGDPILLDYIHGMGKTSEILEYLQESEEDWRQEIDEILDLD